MWDSCRRLWVVHKEKQRSSGKNKPYGLSCPYQSPFCNSSCFTFRSSNLSNTTIEPMTALVLTSKLTGNLSADFHSHQLICVTYTGKPVRLGSPTVSKLRYQLLVARLTIFLRRYWWLQSKGGPKHFSPLFCCETNSFPRALLRGVVGSVVYWRSAWLSPVEYFFQDHSTLIFILWEYNRCTWLTLMFGFSHPHFASQSQITQLLNFALHSIRFLNLILFHFQGPYCSMQIVLLLTFCSFCWAASSCEVTN